MNKHAGQDDELRPEYDPSELLKGEVRDGHADRYRGYKQVVEAPDVAEVSTDDEAVSKALRPVMQLVRIPRPDRYKVVGSWAIS
jgi:hypothetical protein